MEGVFKALGEIYISNNSIFSVFVVLSIVVYSRYGFGLALWGSILGYAMSAALGASNFETKIGLWGYNPALTAMAVGGVFAVPSVKSFLLCSFAVCATQIIFAAGIQLFQPWGMPVATMPFCLGTLLFFSIRKDVSSVTSWIKLPHVTTPEEHYRKWGSSEKRKQNPDGLCDD